MRRSARATVLPFIFAVVLWANAWAGSSMPNVDLSLGVDITPSEFTPGGSQVVSLTVYNSGPDAAGTIPGTSESIYVLEDAFYVDESTPPPFEVVAPISGCYIDRYITEPLPDNRIALLFIFNFEPIPPGGSRTCTYNIVYYSSTNQSFSSGWTVYTVNDTDTNPANDYLPNMYRAAPISVPTTSEFGLVALTYLLGLSGLFALHVLSERSLCAQLVRKWNMRFISSLSR